MRNEALVIGAVLALGGCSSAVPDATGDDDAHDAVVTLEADALATELATSPAHDAARVLAQVELVYDATAPGAVDVSTSVDGVAWSDWATGVPDAEASSGTTVVAAIDVADGARYWRVRAHDGGDARWLTVVPRDADELADEAALDAEESATTAGADDVAGTVAGLTSFRRYSFDAGKVGRSWLWLLRTCRSRGWHGHLSGPRTGLRTYAQQLSLWNAYQNGTGAPAFPPWGPSRHLIRNVKNVGTWYQAVDTDDVPNLIRIARGLGVSLHTPYLPREPWHVEAVHAFGPPRGWHP